MRKRRTAKRSDARPRRGSTQVAKTKTTLERKVALLTKDAERNEADRARDRERVLELEKRALQAPREECEGRGAELKSPVGVGLSARKTKSAGDWNGPRGVMAQTPINDVAIELRGITFPRPFLALHSPVRAQAEKDADKKAEELSKTLAESEASKLRLEAQLAEVQGAIGALRHFRPDLAALFHDGRSVGCR